VPVVLGVCDRKVEAVVVLIHVAPDDVGAEGSIVVGRYEFNIKLTPAIVRPLFSRVTFPEGEEGSASSFLIITLDFGDELSILVCLPGHNFS